MKGLFLILTLLLILPFCLDAQAQNDALNCHKTSVQPGSKMCENVQSNDNKAINLIIENKDVATLTLIILACFCALLAQAKGRRPALWFVLALVIHFIAVIILLCLKDLSSNRQLTN